MLWFQRNRTGCQWQKDVYDGLYKLNFKLFPESGDMSARFLDPLAMTNDLLGYLGASGLGLLSRIPVGLMGMGADLYRLIFHAEGYPNRKQLLVSFVAQPLAVLAMGFMNLMEFSCSLVVGTVVIVIISGFGIYLICIGVGKGIELVFAGVGNFIANLVK